MGKGLAVSGMVLGIVSLVLCWFGVLAFAALPLAIVGLVLSIVGGKKLKANNAPSGIATAGLVIGIIAVVLTGIAFVSCGLCVVLAASVA
ncbi:MAG: hypothetical protein IJA61_00525 [Clostridia bacterium]|nr:hypothetical protein [Clostridia bacterium]